MSEPTIEEAKTFGKLSYHEKAAIILKALGREVSASILCNLPDHEIEQLSVEIAFLKHIDSETEIQVLREFYSMLQASEYISEGDFNLAKEVLETSLGKVQAEAMLKKIQAFQNPGGFKLHKDVDHILLLELIRNENPRTIAYILSQLTPGKAKQVLDHLPEDIQTDIIMHLATFKKILSPEVIRELDSVIDIQLNEDISENFLTSDGVKTLASILSHVDSGTKKSILSNLEMENPEITSSIKNYLFEFEELLFFDDNSIQLILNEVDTEELSIALKAASDELRNKIFKNLAIMIQGEMDYTVPVRLSVIEEIQKRTLEVVRRLMDYATPVRLSVIEKAQKHIVEVFCRLVEEKQIVNVPAIRNFKALA